MRCINNKRVISLGLMFLFITNMCMGCGSMGTPLENSFSVDTSGITVAQEQEAVSYFADDLCVSDDSVFEISADTSASLGACFFNLDTKEVLYADNIYEKLYPASTTKLMTAFVALKYGDLDAQTTVSRNAITFNESGVTTVHLKEGDVLTLRQLLYALLTVSANDAANVIAEMVGGSVEEFANMMNEEAHTIGATNTHFVNPNGLHDEEHYTTVYDLYLIFNQDLQYDEFLDMIQTVSYETTYTGVDGSSVQASWSSTNQFTKGAVTVPDGVTAIGGKTGTTTAAMSCLVQLFEDASGERYAAIILGCRERAILYEEMQGFLSNLNN